MLFHTYYFSYSIIYAETFTILHKYNFIFKVTYQFKQLILVDLCNFYIQALLHNLHSSNRRVVFNKL